MRTVVTKAVVCRPYTQRSAYRLLVLHNWSGSRGSRVFQPINCLFIPYTDTLQRLAQSPHDSSPNTAINQTSISRAQRSPVQSQSPHIASSIVASLTSSSAQQRPARIGPARPRSYRNTRLGLPRDVPSRPLPCPCHAPRTRLPIVPHPLEVHVRPRLCTAFTVLSGGIVATCFLAVVGHACQRLSRCV